METAALKSFATRARTELTGEVTARIDGVLENPRLRQEQPKAVTALERAIAAAGSSSVVAEKIAYTWFNRIIALRYMDANGYTGAGVVSPGPGQAGGPPEILADANRGTINPEIVSTDVAAQVTGLLNGTRTSQDAFGEAYSLLLGEYCRYWNRSMPFMFEAEGDYTELLMPGNLLSPDSVMARAVKVLTPEVCQDVEVIGWLYQFYISERKEEVFAGFKKNKKAGAAEIPAATQLFTPHWIVRYLVENSLGRLWLLNRPSSALADQMEYYIAPVDEETDFLKINSPEELKIIDPACGSGHMLTYAFDLLYAIYEEEGYAPSDIPALILSKNLYGTEIDPRAGALAAFALTMKARHRQRTFLTKNVEPDICVLTPLVFTPAELDVLVTSGGDRHAEETFWNQFEHADTLGSLIQPNEALIGPLREHLKALQQDANDLFLGALLDRATRVLHQAEYLTSRYHVAVANPPYMGSKNMVSLLVDFAQNDFPDSRADLFAMFIERCRRILDPAGGLVAMITMHSWMFLASYEKLRKKILRATPPATMAHLGERAFDSIGGSVVATTAFVLQGGRGMGRAKGVYLRLTDGKNETQKSALARAEIKRESESNFLFRVEPQSFMELPGSPLAYWFPSSLLDAFKTSPPLYASARAAKGMVTADNASYVRQWWEVSRSAIGFGFADRDSAKASGLRWFPYAKGGDFRRWAGNLDAVVNWERDGQSIQQTLTDDGSRVRATNFNLDRIFKPSIAWTVVTTNDPSFRKVEAGYLFDAAAGLCQSTDDEYTLALLNSSSVKQVLAGLNPTMNLHPGYLGAVPMPADPHRPQIRAMASRAVELSTYDWNGLERSWDFSRNALIGRGTSLSGSLDEAQKDWNSIVTEMYDIERQNDTHFARLFGFDGDVELTQIERVSLTLNPRFVYRGLSLPEGLTTQRQDAIRDLVSYAVGCMFGRYSLDEPGLILANQGDTLQEYLEKVPSPSFMPDRDNVIPIVDGDWFEDDIVARFRQFLRVAFGEEHFEENLRFVTESLGVKDLRNYFVKSFYKDHVQRYKKRPIYWLFSSPKGSFNALIYMHRYNSQTASRVLNEYLREFKAKLEASREHHDRLATSAGSAREKSAALKEVDRLRKILFELDEYEHDVLYPVASREIHLDLDDGVKANYPKLGAALKKIPGLEATDE